MIKNHVHTYTRSKLNRKTYRCSDPECSHFARKELILGKYANCPQCNEKFLLTPYQLDLANPTCDHCRGKAKDKDKYEIFDELFSKAPLEDKITLEKVLEDIKVNNEDKRDQSN